MSVPRLWWAEALVGGRPGEGRLSYGFHWAQEYAWESWARFIAMIAGTQSGKTCFTPLWLYREMQRCGPGDYLAVTATFPLLKLKLLPEFEAFFCRGMRLGTLVEGNTDDKGGELRRGDMYIACRDGSRIIFGSATNPESLESATALAAVADEAGQDRFRLAAWEALLRRLSLNQGRVLIATTPYNLGWLKQEVFDRALAGDPDYQVVQFASVTNPAFPPAEYERARRTLPAWKFNMFYGGLFDVPAGLIYGAWDPATHFISWGRFQEITGHARPPVDWPWYVGWDFGPIHTATVWATHCADTGDLFIARETLEGGYTTAEHARRASAHERTLAVGDASPSVYHFGGAPGEGQWRLDLGTGGVAVAQPPVASVEAGIDRVFGTIKGGHLYVLGHCRHVREGLTTYSREVDDAGNPTERIKNKGDFHIIDALRYLVCGLEMGRVGVRWM